jgi:excinuclease ABC subunit A
MDVLIDAGAGYLTLQRSYPTLSAGVAQRLRLAALFGSGRTVVQRVLHKPSLGLRARDTDRLISVLRKLRDQRNTVFAIGHDLNVLKAVDHMVDVGPGARRENGRIVAEGTP